MSEQTPEQILAEGIQAGIQTGIHDAIKPLVDAVAESNTKLNEHLNTQEAIKASEEKMQKQIEEQKSEFNAKSIEMAEQIARLQKQHSKELRNGVDMPITDDCVEVAFKDSVKTSMQSATSQKPFEMENTPLLNSQFRFEVPTLNAKSIDANTHYAFKPQQYSLVSPSLLPVLMRGALDVNPFYLDSSFLSEPQRVLREFSRQIVDLRKNRDNVNLKEMIETSSLPEDSIFAKDKETIKMHQVCMSFSLSNVMYSSIQAGEEEGMQTVVLAQNSLQNKLDFFYSAASFWNKDFGVLYQTKNNTSNSLLKHTTRNPNKIDIYDILESIEKIEGLASNVILPCYVRKNVYHYLFHSKESMESIDGDQQNKETTVAYAHRFVRFISVPDIFFDEVNTTNTYGQFASNSIAYILGNPADLTLFIRGFTRIDPLTMEKTADKKHKMWQYSRTDSYSGELLDPSKGVVGFIKAS